MVGKWEIYTKGNPIMNKDQEAMWNRLKEPAPVISKYGTQYWYNKDGQFHRENDQPAIIYEDGSKFWYLNGKRHRDTDLPVIAPPDRDKL